MSLSVKWDSTQCPSHRGVMRMKCLNADKACRTELLYCRFLAEMASIKPLAMWLWEVTVGSFWAPRGLTHFSFVRALLLPWEQAHDGCWETQSWFHLLFPAEAPGMGESPSMISPQMTHDCPQEHECSHLRPEESPGQDIDLSAIFLFFILSCWSWKWCVMQP